MASLLWHLTANVKKHGYGRSKSRAYFWQPSNLGYRFVSEAKRLLELERDDPSLTTVQAAAILNLTYMVNGVDRPGWKFLHAAVEMAHEIDLFTQGAEFLEREQIARTTTSWCLFNWQRLVTWHCSALTCFTHSLSSLF